MSPPDSPQGPVTERFQLSLDGGGYKGIFSAAVLAAIEQDLGRSITQHFDLIVGTSAGGIIALGLGIGRRPSQVVDFYSQCGPRIFRGAPLLTGWGLWRRRYGHAALREALQVVLEDRVMEESAIPLVIPAFDLGQNEVYLFKTPHRRARFSSTSARRELKAARRLDAYPFWPPPGWRQDGSLPVTGRKPSEARMSLPPNLRGQRAEMRSGFQRRAG